MALPAIDGVGRDAESIGDLANGKVNGLSHDGIPLLTADISAYLHYSGQPDGIAGGSQKSL